VDALVVVAAETEGVGDEAVTVDAVAEVLVAVVVGDRLEGHPRASTDRAEEDDEGLLLTILFINRLRSLAASELANQPTRTRISSFGKDKFVTRCSFLQSLRLRNNGHRMT